MKEENSGEKQTIFVRSLKSFWVFMIGELETACERLKKFRECVGEHGESFQGFRGRGFIDFFPN